MGWNVKLLLGVPGHPMDICNDMLHSKWLFFLLEMINVLDCTSICAFGLHVQVHVRCFNYYANSRGWLLICMRACVMHVDHYQEPRIHIHCAHVSGAYRGLAPLNMCICHVDWTACTMHTPYSYASIEVQVYTASL